MCHPTGVCACSYVVVEAFGDDAKEAVALEAGVDPREAARARAKRKAAERAALRKRAKDGACVTARPLCPPVTRAAHPVART